MVVGVTGYLPQLLKVSFDIRVTEMPNEEFEDFFSKNSSCNVEWRFLSIPAAS